VNKNLADADRLLQSGQFEAAADACRKSIRMNRDTALAIRMLAACHYNLGVRRLQQPGPTIAAQAEFRRALELDPAHTDAANNLGSALLVEGSRQAAIDLFRSAAKQRPREMRYQLNLTRALVLGGRLDEASAMLARCAELNPENAGAYLLTDAILTEQIAPDSDYPRRIREVIATKFERLAHEEHAISNPLEMSGSYFPLSYHGIGNIDIARAMATLYLKWCPSLAWASAHVEGWKPPEKRIRIGLVSWFFRNHSISNTTRGLIEQLDRERFEVIVIRLVPSPGDENARLIDKAADRVVTVPPGLQPAREAIASLGLDVLFYQDVGLEPASYFLAFSRLAPVQLTSFGHPDTTGIPNLDYFVSSSLYELPGAQRDYSEQLVEIPGAGTLAYYHRPPVPERAAARSELGLEEGDHAYLCPQTLQKIQPAMDEAFAKIAALDPRARIVLIDFDADQRKALERRLAHATDRVRFIPLASYDRFLARLAAADVILDTMHFNGQNTTLEAFTVGTPVVTLPGTLQRSRHGYGMYKAMGFMDLVAEDLDDYARKAVRIATDAGYREHCRNRILESSGVLFENQEFVQSMEDALATMVRDCG